MGNHVYHARYLEILEAARGEFFRTAGVPLSSLIAMELFFPVVESHLHHEATARYDDELDVEVVVTDLDLLKISFAYGISNSRNQIILSGLTRHICTGTDEKPKRMPPDFFNKLSLAFTGKAAALPVFLAAPVAPAAPAAPAVPAATLRTPKTPSFPT